MDSLVSDCHLGSDAEAHRKLPLETASQPHTLFHRQVELRPGALQAQQGSLLQTLTGQEGRKRKPVRSQGAPDPPAHPTAAQLKTPHRLPGTPKCRAGGPSEFLGNNLCKCSDLAVVEFTGSWDLNGIENLLDSCLPPMLPDG